MSDIELIGFPQSSYVWAVRMALEEKGVQYDLVTDIDLASEIYAEDHHPFRKMPAFHHGDVEIFESSAIMRYIDEAFEGPSLTPSSIIGRARMNQWMSAIGDYLYDSAIRNLVIPRLARPELADEAKIAANQETLRAHLAVFDRALYEDHWLAGMEFSLADCMLAPIIAYLGMVPEGKEALERWVHLARFVDHTQSRVSFQKASPSAGKK